MFSYWKYISIILSFFSSSLGENKLVYSKKFLHLLKKSITQIQKYPHIIELFNLSIIVLILLWPINILVSFGIDGTPKLSSYVTL